MSTETPTERREAAATRRRWVTLAEVVAVAGVLIAALTLSAGWATAHTQGIAAQIYAPDRYIAAVLGGVRP